MIGVRKSADDEVIIGNRDETIRTSGGNQLVDEQDPEGGDVMWQRLGPEKQNARGAVVVEVEKVARDLTMVLNTVRTAKFCRLLVGTVPQVSASATLDTVEGNQKTDLPLQLRDQKEVVVHYRDLLNDFFKLIARLNHASD